MALNVVALGSRSGMGEVLPPGIVDATANLLVASGVVGPAAVRFCRSRMGVGLFLAFDWMLPGQFQAFAHRKRFCEQETREGIRAGAEQVLVLGAGYDTLGWRLAPEFPGVRFVEIDHPATLRLKARGIEAMGERDNLHLLAESLEERPLVDVLRHCRVWDPAAPTVIVAEGLLMYLPPEAVRTLLKGCAASCGPSSRVAFSYVATGPDGRPDAGPWASLVLWLLKVGGEKWQWSIHHEELPGFLADVDWTLSTDGSPPRHGVEFYGVAQK